jgi:hypothetical protein
MNTQSPVTAILDAVKVAENQVRVDVVLKNVPEDLFGAAFHLKAEGVGWVLKRFEAGDVFSAAGFEPMILAEEKSGGKGDKEIIFGISLKRTDAVTVRDGVLARFYLQTEGDGTLKMEFSDTRLSILDSSGRDIGNADWESGSFNLAALKMQQSELQTNLLRADDIGAFQLNGFTGVYVVMVVCLAVFLVFFIVYLFYKRRRDFKD